MTIAGADDHRAIRQDDQPGVMTAVQKVGYDGTLLLDCRTQTPKATLAQRRKPGAINPGDVGRNARPNIGRRLGDWA